MPRVLQLEIFSKRHLSGFPRLTLCKHRHKADRTLRKGKNYFALYNAKYSRHHRILQIKVVYLKEHYFAMHIYVRLAVSKDSTHLNWNSYEWFIVDWFELKLNQICLTIIISNKRVLSVMKSYCQTRSPFAFILNAVCRKGTQKHEAMFFRIEPRGSVYWHKGCLQFCSLDYWFWSACYHCSENNELFIHILQKM